MTRRFLPVFFLFVFSSILMNPESRSVAQEIKKPDSEAKAANARIVNVEHWGKTTDGQSVSLYTLSNNNGLRLKLTNYGATILKPGETYRFVTTHQFSIEK